MLIVFLFSYLKRVVDSSTAFQFWYKPERTNETFAQSQKSCNIVSHLSLRPQSRKQPSNWDVFDLIQFSWLFFHGFFYSKMVKFTFFLCFNHILGLIPVESTSPRHLLVAVVVASVAGMLLGQLWLRCWFSGVCFPTSGLVEGVGLEFTLMWIARRIWRRFLGAVWILTEAWCVWRLRMCYLLE